tara:strand:- start:141 stop:773 length:633 start_codon:yes stop_codon:yes gene_type:complete
MITKYEGVISKTKTWEQKQVTEKLVIAPQTFRYWATIKAFSPHTDSIGKPGVRRRYDLYNCVEAAILRELHSKGVHSSIAEQALKKLDIRKRKTIKGPVFIQILDDGDVKVITEDNLFELERRFSEEIQEKNILRKPHPPASLMVANEFAELLKNTSPKHYNVMKRVIFESYLYRAVLQSNFSTIIVLVHRLWDEVEEKFGEQCQKNRIT